MHAPQDPYLIDSHKMMWHSDRIAQWQNAKTDDEKLNVFPIYVEISPVGHCNHRCTFCAVDYIGYKTRALASNTLSNALDSMANSGVKSVMLAGEGEPMLHPDIALITNAAGRHIDLSFTTNGTAMTKKFVDEALHAVKWIKVSMNGGPETYAKIHQTKAGDYERVWKNIEYALGQRCARNLSCAVGIQCVVLPENRAELDSLIRRARETGCDYIVLKPYSQHKSSITTTYQDIDYKDQHALQALVKYYSTDTFKVICRETAMEDWDAKTHKYKTCLSTPYFWAYIMATGDVYGCSAYLLNPEFCYGNIYEASFRDIWLGRKRRSHLKKMETLDISKCRVNCRMNQVNKYLDMVVNPNPHANFI